MYLHPSIGGISDAELCRANFDKSIIRILLLSDGARAAEFYDRRKSTWQPLDDGAVRLLCGAYPHIAIEFFAQHKLLK